MGLNSLMYCSTYQGYSASIGNGVISQVLDGGADRYRRSLKGVPHSVSSRWVVTESGYQYLMAFYRVWQRNPNKPFIAKLCVDDSVLQDYQCYFDASNGLVLAEQRGKLFVVTGTLKVKPLKIDPAIDDIIVDVGNSGTDLAALLNPLEKLVNEDFPNALGNIDG